jgi:hypothetical protein
MFCYNEVLGHRTNTILRMNERENSRKRVSEVCISEESPKRLRVSDGTAQKTSVTQTPDATAPKNLDSRDEQLVSALLELKYQARVDAELPANDGIPTFIQSLLVRINCLFEKTAILI